MFEVRNSTAHRLLHMLTMDRKRSHAMAASVHALFNDEEDASGSSDPDLSKMLVAGIGTITAAISGLLVTHHDNVDGKEMPSALDKGTDWVKDQFGGDKDKDKGKDGNTVVGTSLAPSPLANPDAVNQNKVKTAKADDSTQDAIKKAAGDQSVDYALLYAIAGAESSFRSDVGAVTSSAVGLFQFTESTWSYLCKQFKLDFTSRDRKDPRKSAQVGGLFVRSISETLQKNLGRKPSYGEVYMGYFLGPSGAVKFLKAAEKNPDAPGADLFPKAAKSNPNVFFNRGDPSQPLTLRQILAKQEGKIISYAQDANPNQAVASSPISAQPIQVALANPDAKRGSSSGSTSSPSVSSDTSAGYRASVNATKVTGVQSAPSVTNASYQEKAPTPIETQDQSTNVASSTIIPSSGADQQQKTHVRGRDGRVYVLNS